MRRNEITCSTANCGAVHKEQRFNEGHPGWGDINGIADEKGECPHLCPACMKMIKNFLDTGIIENDLG